MNNQIPLFEGLRQNEMFIKDAEQVGMSLEDFYQIAVDVFYNKANDSDRVADIREKIKQEAIQKLKALQTEDEEKD